jgi:organic radical activating enzyme
MKIKGLIDEDFVNYKLPSMFIATSKCSFKCDAECGKAVCQNLPLATAPVIEISCKELVDRYVSNNISQAVCLGGLEPFDDIDELMAFICEFRSHCNDDIVIYTGYYEDEIQPYVNKLKADFKNIVIKFGRYIPDQQPHYDEVLGINLASDNQKGVRIC